MPDIIVDTSGLIAFFVKSEMHHPTARYFMAANATSQWIVLETVFDEFVTWVRAKVSIKSSIQIGRILRREHIYVNISDTDDLAIWEAFAQYDDKYWSYTDCSILVMAQKLGISDIFAFDDHIRQMAGLGITCVP